MKSLDDYIKIYNNAISSELCTNTISDIQNNEWIEHGYRYPDGSVISYDKELSVSFNSSAKSYQPLMDIIWVSLQRYMNDINDYCFNTWSGYSTIRFNKYDKNTLMKKHCDHIHSLFPGEPKGIPVLSVVGLLNNEYTGGEFIMYDDKIINLKAGDLIIFPSIFLYPHRVNEITDGTRYSFVSWAW
jgi:predicted 2-oxoglutarate/Fe(II)-dependent dioxygenase YbiX